MKWRCLRVTEEKPKLMAMRSFRSNGQKISVMNDNFGIGLGGRPNIPIDRRQFEYRDSPKETIMKNNYAWQSDFDPEDLISCAHWGYDAVEPLKELLKKDDVDINATDLTGNTALAWAVRKHNEDVVKILIDAGADVNIQNDQLQSPLAHAVRRGFYDLTKLLLENGAEVNTEEKEGRTPLHFCFRLDSLRPDICKLLIEHGAKFF